MEDFVTICWDKKILFFKRNTSSNIYFFCFLKKMKIIIVVIIWFMNFVLFSVPWSGWFTSAKCRSQASWRSPTSGTGRAVFPPTNWDSGKSTTGSAIRCAQFWMKFWSFFKKCLLSGLLSKPSGDCWGLEPGDVFRVVHIQDLEEPDCQEVKESKGHNSQAWQLRQRLGSWDRVLTVFYWEHFFRWDNDRWTLPLLDTQPVHQILNK